MLVTMHNREFSTDAPSDIECNFTLRSYTCPLLDSHQAKGSCNFWLTQTGKIGGSPPETIFEEADGND